MEKAYAPRAGLYAPDLIPCCRWTRRSFGTGFGSPILRAKRKGLLRNVAVALGNTKSPEALPALMRALNDEETLVRGHVAWALGQIGSPKAISALGKRLRIENDPTVRMEIEDAITEARKTRSAKTDSTASNIE